MNLFKSAFSISKSDQVQLDLQHYYQDVKSWDCSRARALQNHLRIVQLVMDALDGKVIQVQKYIEGLQKIMSSRIQQITTYCKNGVNDSQFFLVPNSLNALKPCHQLLKHLLMQQSQRQLNLSKKASILSSILQRLKLLKSEECSQKHQERQRQGDSVRQLKSSIRFLIDCELPDLILDVLTSCKQVSIAQTEEKDFYWAVEKFVRMAQKQLKKHHQIGKQLLILSETLANREKRLRTKLREILIQWVRQDLQDKVFQEQLNKNNSEQLIDDYYDIQNLCSEHSSLWNGVLLSEYLQNMQILPFRQHQRLVVYSRQVLYNGKIQAKLILTQQKYAYLFRLQANEPDFNFIVSKNIRVKVKNSLVVSLLQWRRTLILREQIQFQFSLQFNLEGDLKQFVEKIAGLGSQIQRVQN